MTIIVAALIQRTMTLAALRATSDVTMPSRNPYSLTGVNLSALLVVSLILVYVT